MNGKGKMNYIDGRNYEGEYKDGLMEGKGIFKVLIIITYLYISGKMVEFMMENILMIENMAMENFLILLVKFMKDIGKMV